MKSILISHSNAKGEPDLPISLELYGYLSEHKIDCWIDAKLKVGEWDAQIGRVMLETPIVIFVASRNSMASDEVMGEVLYYRRTKGKIIIPFVIDKQYYLNIDSPAAVYSFGSNRYQAVFLEDYVTHEEAFERLISLLPSDIAHAANNPADFEYLNGDDSVLVKYDGQDACVTIPSYVKEIGEKAFMCNQSLTKVIIPSSVKKIGAKAFRGCKNLIAVEGMDGLTEIEASAFDGSGVDPKQNGYVFKGVVFGCEDDNAKSIVIPEGTLIIANEAFRYCNAEQIVLPKGLQTIGEVAFADSVNLQTVLVPASVKRIGKNAFRSCSKLEKVIFEGEIPCGAEQGFENLQKLINAEDK